MYLDSLILTSFINNFQLENKVTKQETFRFTQEINDQNNRN